MNAISYDTISELRSDQAAAIEEFESAIDFAEAQWPTSTLEQKRLVAAELRHALVVFIAIARAPDLELTTSERTRLAACVQRGRSMAREVWRLRCLP